MFVKLLFYLRNNLLSDWMTNPDRCTKWTHVRYSWYLPMLTCNFGTNRPRRPDFPSSCLAKWGWGVVDDYEMSNIYLVIWKFSCHKYAKTLCDFSIGTLNKFKRRCYGVAQLSIPWTVIRLITTYTHGRTNGKKLQRFGLVVRTQYIKCGLSVHDDLKLYH